MQQPTPVSALHYRHIELGAEMVEHEGWTLPARYTDPDDEAASVKKAVGISDFSPVGKIRLQGESVQRAILATIPDYLATGVGSAAVTKAGHVVARLADDDYLIITEPEQIKATLKSLSQDGCAHPVNVTSVFACVHIVGPSAPQLLAGVTDFDLAPPFFLNLSCAQTMVAEIHCTVIRRDIGNLLSYDLYFSRDYGDHMWESLVDAGELHGVTPLGFEAMLLLGK